MCVLRQYPGPTAWHCLGWGRRSRGRLRRRTRLVIRTSTPAFKTVFTNLVFSVRRAKAQFFSGCNSHPATFAPAGSNRSGSGGNETAEAFDAEGRLGRPGEQAGRNVSER